MRRKHNVQAYGDNEAESDVRANEISQGLMYISESTWKIWTLCIIKLSFVQKMTTDVTLQWHLFSSRNSCRENQGKIIYHAC